MGFHYRDISKPRRNLDQIVARTTLKVRPARDAEIPHLVALCAAEIPGLVAFEDATVNVQRHNPRAILAITDQDVPIGVIAALPLNPLGTKLLLDGSFPFDAPAPDLLALPDEAPDAIYVWSICARGRAGLAIPLIMRWLGRDGWQNADMFGKPSSPAGARLMAKGGFVPFDCRQPNLWRFRRSRSVPMA